MISPFAPIVPTPVLPLAVIVGDNRTPLAIKAASGEMASMVTPEISSGLVGEEDESESIANRCGVDRMSSVDVVEVAEWPDE